MERRASVQRVLALSDVESARMVQTRAAKRFSQHGVKRRSSHIDAFDVASVSEAGSGSKRSSASASVAGGKRRSFVRRLGAGKGGRWSVVRMGTKWLGRMIVLWLSRILTMMKMSGMKMSCSRSVQGQSEKMDVDVVLADLRAAQEASQKQHQQQQQRRLGHVKEEGSGEKTPTQETSTILLPPLTLPARAPTGGKAGKAKDPTPPRPSRSTRREPVSPTKESMTTHSSSSISSVDSFTSGTSGTGTALTAADEAGTNQICFSRPFSPHGQERFSVDDNEDASRDKENVFAEPEDGKVGMKQSNSQFRLSLALAPLQPLDLFQGV